MNLHSLPKKKELGAYYTPPELSQVLADWAIQSQDENILEPSFGGCGFFESSIIRLKKLGCSKPEERLFGVDIDDQAFDILSSKFGKIIDTNKRFILDDFIKVQPTDFIVPNFDVVLGNPPYVSMHNMTSEQRKSCDDVLTKSPFVKKSIGRNASLWAFFLLHSLSFLNEGGRIAWVLPSSLLHADYAMKLLAVHQKHFMQIKVIKLAERFFKAEGAEETSIILIGEGFSKQPLSDKGLIIHSISNLTELVECIEATEDSNITDIKDYKLNLISREARASYEQLNNSPFSKTLGHYADIKIGMVTGANKYFIVDKSIVEKFGLPEEVLKPAIGKFAFLSGITHDMKKHKKLQNDGNRAYLVCPKEEHMLDPSHPVKRYLNQISEQEKDKNKTFAKRPHWYVPDYGIDSIVADCFLSYMIHHGPRMVVNKAKLNCTNSIHKVIFRNITTAATKQAIATTILSTYSQFSAEIEGRAYSSGVLKIEPTAGKNIKVLFTPECIDDLVGLKPQIEQELLNDNYGKTAELVDSILIKHGLITIEQCNELSKGIHNLRQERYKGIRIYNE